MPPSPPPYPVPAGTKPAVPDRVERALWFGSPARALVLVADRTDPYAGWLRAVALLAVGEYAAAERTAAEVTGEYAALAAATRASAARQQHRYAAARELDRRALGGDLEARADGLVGLTADAVGLGELGEAADRLAELDRITEAAGWRAGIRRDWVACELALASDRPADASEAAERALRRSRCVAAPRHLAKSLLFCGVSWREVARRTGDVPKFRAAAAILSAAERLGRAIGAEPLASVAYRVRQDAVREVAEVADSVAQNTSVKIVS